MALTKDFKATIQARAQRDPAFRKALLQEGIEVYRRLGDRVHAAGGLVQLGMLQLWAGQLVEGLAHGRSLARPDVEDLAERGLVLLRHPVERPDVCRREVEHVDAAFAAVELDGRLLVDGGRLVDGQAD